MRRLMKIAGWLLLAIVGLAATLLVGMRNRSPTILRVVRRTNRAVLNPIQMRSAGTPGAYASIIRHRGRTSGRTYETPVGAQPTDDGFVIALPYGTGADWLKNVLAGGSAEIVHGGRTHHVHQPDIVPLATAVDWFPADDQRAFRMFNVNECLRVRRVDGEETASG